MDLPLDEDQEFSIPELQELTEKINSAYLDAEAAWETDGSPVDIDQFGRLCRVVSDSVRVHLVRIAHLKRTLRNALDFKLSKLTSLEDKLELLAMYQ